MPFIEREVFSKVEKKLFSIVYQYHIYEPIVINQFVRLLNSQCFMYFVTNAASKRTHALWKIKISYLFVHIKKIRNLVCASKREV
jgi:hypothetical protein